MHKCTIFTGPMKSGKTKYLIINYTLTKEKTPNLIMLKPKIDNRFSNDYVMSRDGLSAIAENINNLNDLYKYTNYENIFIDEFQLLPGDVKSIIPDILEYSNLFIAGLNLTSDLEPFGKMNDAMCFADNIVILNGTCDICGNEQGKYTICTQSKSETIKLGDNIYKCVCPNCYRNTINLK